jgi:hypothetical protein
MKITQVGVDHHLSIQNKKKHEVKSGSEITTTLQSSH